MTESTRKLDYVALRDRLTKGRSALQPRLKEDLLERAKQPTVAGLLRETWDREKKDKLTGDALGPWTERLCAQIASAWILTTLFVRVLEDRGLLHRKRLFGPQAEEAREAMIRLAPRTGARDYLLLVFQELQEFPAAKPLFDAAHNLAWRLTPSAELADAVLAFWAETDGGEPVFPFHPGATGGTGFLGDLYQDLDAQVRERYALLQTPPFVANFILDRTLTPALETFGLGDADEPTRMIDPTCGSGHFLLLGFERLLKAWRVAAPGAGRKIHVERALSSLYGVDLNPYAVSIARFRLTLAALEALELTSLNAAPKLKLNLAVADSLLFREGQQLPLRTVSGTTFSESEIFDLHDRLAEELLRKKYHVVVGNPPYIEPKDKARKRVYSQAYPQSAQGGFSLSAPFTERFFDFATEGAGYTGLIVANNFLKRSFGKGLVERVLPEKELTQVIDSSGAYIPGHGTPTVILFGRNRSPTKPRVRAVLGIRGEPEVPTRPAEGLVWRTIADHADMPGHEDDYITVTDLPRTRVSRHPLVLAGGGALELWDDIRKRHSVQLSEQAPPVGFYQDTHADTAFIQPEQLRSRYRLEPELVRPQIRGDGIRDWETICDEFIVFPYVEDRDCELVEEDPFSNKPNWHWFWRTKPKLWERADFGAPSYRLSSKRKHWFEFHQIAAWRAQGMKIAFAFVASHNHFVFEEGQAVFNRSAPVIKLAPNSNRSDYLDLVGLLNSSTGQFLFRMECHDKGLGGIGGGIHPEHWSRRMEFAGKNVDRFPLVGDRDRELRIELVRSLLACGQDRSSSAREAIRAIPEGSSREEVAAVLQQARVAESTRRQRMIALQEELDWLTYRTYGLLQEEECPVLEPSAVPKEGLVLGHRPFEIALQRSVNAGRFKTAWFERHGSTPVSSVPLRYAESYRKLMETRLGLIERYPRTVGLVEQPEKKRRWSQVDWGAEVQSAAREWLLDELEADLQCRDPRPWSLRDLAQALDRSPKRRFVLELALGRNSHPAVESALKLVYRQSVPAIAALRYQPSGLAKHVRWREIWRLQVCEDTGEQVSVPKPPNFSSKDFAAHYWSCRGKLDVPKERFILLPQASDDENPGPLFLWAGWDHLAQAREIAGLLSKRLNTLEGGREEAARQLIPLFCALDELIFWVRLCWPEPDEEFGNVWGDTFEEFIRGKLPKLGLQEFQTREDLANWRPKKKAKRATRRKAKKEPPDPGAIEDALQSLGGEAKAADLAKALGVTQKLLKMATKTLEDDVLEVTKKRPLTYRLARAEAAPEEGEK